MFYLIKKEANGKREENFGIISISRYYDDG